MFSDLFGVMTDDLKPLGIIKPPHDLKSNIAQPEDIVGFGI
jgi:hypothetical protein